jgi:hypothetical protein
MAQTVRILIGCVAAAVLAACAGTTPRAVDPPGAPKTATTRVLETGARVLQTQTPLAPMDVYLVGFHAMKDDPAHQMEAHHFCRQVNADFMQCVLFDGNTASANLTGIEYIISERLFETLPEDERSYWHPHNYEILSGQLVAPGVPGPAEHKLMEGKMNSYGKTWHVWSTTGHGHRADRLPLGDAMLAWSFNRDGEAIPGLVEAAERRLGIDTAAKRESRRDLVPLARPQEGVDALHGQFDRPTTPLRGVADKSTAGAASTTPAGAERR